MNPDSIKSLIDVLERSKSLLNDWEEEMNYPYDNELSEKIDIELIILKGMQMGMIIPIRDFLSRLRAEKTEEPYSSLLEVIKQEIILDYLSEQIKKLEVK